MNKKLIIINARFLTQPKTGVQRFAIEISKILKFKLGDRVQFVTHPGIIHSDLAKELNAKVIGINKSHLWEQLDLYLFLLKKGSPLLISFGYTGPFFYHNQIISVHDMAFKYYKETFSKSFAFTYNFLVPRIARKCLHVFTVSRSAKSEISKELNLPDSKITVIYNGLSEVFKKSSKSKFEKEFKERYILTVSSHHQRKNYGRLVEAFAKINDSDIYLYVVGNKIPHFSENSINKKNNLNKRIKILYNIDDVQLNEYYENAELFVFPSLYEGFGIPAIEAMSKGCLCVLSDIPVFREIGDDSVIYVDPLDVSSIRSGIEKGLERNSSKIVYEKLSEFSWTKSTNMVLDLIKRYCE